MPPELFPFAAFGPKELQSSVPPTCIPSLHQQGKAAQCLVMKGFGVVAAQLLEDSDSDRIVDSVRQAIMQLNIGNRLQTIASACILT